MRKRAAIVALVVLAIIIVVVLAITTSRKGMDRNTVVTSGTIEATEVEIAAKVTGRIEEILAREGESVRRGELLVTIVHEELLARRREIEAAIGAAEAQLAQVRDNLRNARADGDRFRALYEQGALPRQQLEAQETRVAVLESQVTAARKLLDQATSSLGSLEAQITNYSVPCPLDGVVLSRNAEPGEIALPGGSILTVADLSRVWMRVYVGEPDLARIKLGQSAKVTTDASPGEPHWGQVSWISEEAEFTPKNVQTKEERSQLVYALKIALDNPDRALKPGMMADAEIAVK
jgi:HlyD family secretion protein